MNKMNKIKKMKKMNKMKKVKKIKKNEKNDLKDMYNKLSGLNKTIEETMQEIKKKPENTYKRNIIIGFQSTNSNSVQGKQKVLLNTHYAIAKTYIGILQLYGKNAKQDERY